MVLAKTGDGVGDDITYKHEVVAQIIGKHIAHSGAETSHDTYLVAVGLQLEVGQLVAVPFGEGIADSVSAIVIGIVLVPDGEGGHLRQEAVGG